MSRSISIAEKQNQRYQLQKKGRGFLFGLFRLAILFGLSFVVLYPLINMFSIAFRDVADLVDPGVIWVPKNFTMENIRDAWKFMDYSRSLVNTVLLGVVPALLQTASCALVGYGFARFQFKGKKLLFMLVLFTILIPQSVVYMPTYLMYRHFNPLGIMSLIGLITGNTPELNLLNTPFTILLPAILAVGLRSGLFIYIFRQFFRNLPRELEDAAYIDGCGSLSTFGRIVLPNAVNAIITCLLFSLVWNWNDYYTVVMYFSDTKTVSVALVGIRDAMTAMSEYEGIRSDPYQVATRLQAGCLLSIAPLLMLFTVAERFFTQGLERSGIVG